MRVCGDHVEGCPSHHLPCYLSAHAVPSPRHKPSVSIFADRRPDADKNEEELRVELGQLRDVWRMDQDELKKLHAVRQGGILRGEEHTLQGLP